MIFIELILEAIHALLFIELTRYAAIFWRFGSALLFLGVSSVIFMEQTPAGCHELLPFALILIGSICVILSLVCLVGKW